MSYSYQNSFTSNASELMLEKMRAQQAERRVFGNSVLAEVEGDLSQVPRTVNPNVVTAPVNNQNSNVISNTTPDPNDDGKLSFKEKLVNFGKGLILPIKKVFESPKNMLITAAGVVAGAALIAATGGAAAPFMVAAGVLGGSMQIAKGYKRQANAKTDAEAATGWQEMGSGTFVVGTSVASTKGAMKAAKSGAPKGMAGIQAWIKNLKNVPGNITNSIKNLFTKITSIFNKSKGTTVSTTVTTGGAVPQLPSGKTTALLPAATTTNGTKSSTVINNADGDILALSAPQQRLALPPAREPQNVIQLGPGTAQEVIALPESNAPILLGPGKGQVPDLKYMLQPKNAELLRRMKNIKLPANTTNSTPVVAGQEVKLLPEPKQPLLLEAPKSANVPVEAPVVTADANPTPKVGLWGKIKNFLNNYGLFLDE